ncbi:hypothetical protein [Echinicola sp. 20G]|uniref:hypothetical protein n=1 Tax=Echinicola sp. 20G TaxID=2781961 RepID=UPI001910AC48|nr:hypothetical protein [Echinicola sp. 20G]
MAAITVNPYYVLQASCVLVVLWMIENLLLYHEDDLRRAEGQSTEFNMGTSRTLKGAFKEFLFSRNSLFYWTAFVIHIFLFLFLMLTK